MVKLAFAFIAAVVLCFCGGYAANLLAEELDSLTDFKYGNLKIQRIRSEAPYEEDAEFQDDNFKDYDGSKEEQGWFTVLCWRFAMAWDLSRLCFIRH